MGDTRLSPSAPLRLCAGNRLIHAYFDIDLDIVWDTTVLDLPPLVAGLAKLVGEAGSE